MLTTYLRCLGGVAVQAVALYLIPWARIFDSMAARAAAKWPRLLPWTWHIAATMLAVTGCVHVACIAHILASLADRDLWGLESPCVCAASELAVRRRQLSSCEAFLVSIIDVVRATVYMLATGTRVTSELCLAVLNHPRLTTCVVVVVGSISQTRS